MGRLKEGATEAGRKPQKGKLRASWEERYPKKKGRRIFPS